MPLEHKLLVDNVEGVSFVGPPLLGNLDGSRLQQSAETAVMFQGGLSLDAGPLGTQRALAYQGIVADLGGDVAKVPLYVPLQFKESRHLFFRDEKSLFPLKFFKQVFGHELTVALCGKGEVHSVRVTVEQLERTPGKKFLEKVEKLYDSQLSPLDNCDVGGKGVGRAQASTLTRARGLGPSCEKRVAIQDAIKTVSDISEITIPRVEGAIEPTAGICVKLELCPRLIFI